MNSLNHFLNFMRHRHILIELADDEVQAVRCWFVPEFSAVDDSARVSTVQLAVSFVIIVDLAAQLSNVRISSQSGVFLAAVDGAWACSISRLLSLGLL